MPKHRLLGLALAAGLLAATAEAATPPNSPGKWQIPIATKTLPNGLTVVVSEDHSAPTFGLCSSTRSASVSSRRAGRDSPTSSST